MLIKKKNAQKTNLSTIISGKILKKKKLKAYINYNYVYI